MGTKNTCKYCGRSGWFLKLSNDGLCDPCTAAHVPVIVRGFEVMKESMELVRDSKNIDTRISRCGVILDNAERLLKYERRGLTPVDPLPSELIETYSALRDHLRAEKMVEENPHGDLTEAADQSCSLSDDQYRADRDILKGLRFCATMSLDTPLDVLEHHGEMFEGLPSRAPMYGGPAEGMWIPEVDWSSVGASPPPEGKMASVVGPIPTDGGGFLKFLKDFRSIVESDAPVPERLSEIRSLTRQNSTYREFGRKLGDDFAEEWFAARFTEIPGVGAKTALNLFRAGFHTPDDLANASVEDLTSVTGVGRKTAETIRETTLDV